MPEAEDVACRGGREGPEDRRPTAPRGGRAKRNTTDSAGHHSRALRHRRADAGRAVAAANRDKACALLAGARQPKLSGSGQQAEVAAARKAQVGSGDRAEKIRTYNFPENRLTDHRVKHTAHRLDQNLDGDLTEFTEALQAEERRLAPGRRRLSSQQWPNDSQRAHAAGRRSARCR